MKTEKHHMEEKYSKYIAVKQGAMLLLTGKIRMV